MSSFDVSSFILGAAAILGGGFIIVMVAGGVMSLFDLIKRRSPYQDLELLTRGKCRNCKGRFWAEKRSRVREMFLSHKQTGQCEWRAEHPEEL
jgi:hypothetical protein